MTQRKNTSRLGAAKDSDDLGPLVGPDGWCIGSVPHINGDLSHACPDFVPTKYELLQVARFWHGILQHNAFLWEEFGSTGSTEYRECIFAERRLKRIGDIIGQDELDRFIEKSGAL